MLGAVNPWYSRRVVNLILIMQANQIKGGIQAQALALPMRVFAAHAGVGQPVEGYGATPWRQWLIVGIANVWYAVRKDAPLATPVACRCALADVKAHLKAGSILCGQA
jgi:hypothetical protein